MNVCCKYKVWLKWIRIWCAIDGIMSAIRFVLLLCCGNDFKLCILLRIAANIQNRVTHIIKCICIWIHSTTIQKRIHTPYWSITCNVDNQSTLFGNPFPYFSVSLMHLHCRRLSDLFSLYIYIKWSSRVVKGNVEYRVHRLSAIRL